jgi:hypothetical protein
MTTVRMTTLRNSMQPTNEWLFHINNYFILGDYIPKVREKYNLASQITTLYPDGLPNYQSLHYGPPKYQNLWKIPLFGKYPHNTPATCQFLIQKIQEKIKK